MKKLLCLLAAATLLYSCSKKKDEPAATPCSSQVWALSIPHTSMLDTITSCSLGMVTAPAAFSGVGSLSISGYTKQGAFSALDNCYYVFKNRMGSEQGSVLYRVSTAGSVSVLTNSASSTAGFAFLSYNKVENKLYCVGYASGVHLCEITVSGTTFTATPVATSVHSTMWATGLTADNVTGAMYLAVGDTTNTYVEKRASGASSFSVTNTISHPAFHTLGLSANPNDNMLYAVKSDWTAGTGSLLKIDPATGSVTSLGSFGKINPEFYAAAFDPCANEYILSDLSAITPAISTVLMRISTSGALISSTATTSLISGLAVDY